MLNAVHLQTFVDVMRTGSFAVTARRLRYTPSAVSQQISALERATQVQLFLRSASGVRPTAAAEYVVADAQVVLGSLRSVAERFNELAAGSAGIVRIGSFPSASQRLVPEIFARVGHRQPTLQIRLDEGEPRELVSLIKTQELDVAIVYQYDLVPEPLGDVERTEQLLVEELVLAVPQGHWLADVDSVTVCKLAAEPWITTRLGTDAITMLNRLCARASFIPRVVHQSNDYSVIQELVAAGLGIAIVPSLATVEDPRRRFVRLEADQAVRRVHAVSNSASSRTAVDDLLSDIRSAARVIVEAHGGLAIPATSRIP